MDQLNLDVRKGEIHGFIGHNGAGKTTTIRALAGVLEFEEGEILIAGHSIQKEPVLCKSMMAYIPDNPDLYDYLTGIQYLNYIGDMFGVPAKERKEEIEKYGDLLSLTKELGGLIGSYSHGMKQKLALISAFMHHPRLLVLDEPFVGLDPEASFHLKEMMKELCAGGERSSFPPTCWKWRKSSVTVFPSLRPASSLPAEKPMRCAETAAWKKYFWR